MMVDGFLRQVDSARFAKVNPTVPVLAGTITWHLPSLPSVKSFKCAARRGAITSPANVSRRSDAMSAFVSPEEAVLVTQSEEITLLTGVMRARGNLTVPRALIWSSSNS